jgi:hypothetical protein
MPIMVSGRKNVSWKNRGKFGESAEETLKREDSTSVQNLLTTSEIEEQPRTTVRDC